MGIISHSLSTSADTSRLLSPALWNNCPILDMLLHKRDGVFVYEEWLTQDDEDGADAGWMRYIDTGNTIRQVATNTTALATGLRGGVLRLSADASDNDAPIIQYQTANGAAPFIIGNTAGAAWPFWLEARIKKSSITDNQAAFFVGLAQAGTAADDGLLADNTGDLVDSISAIGWRVLQDNGEELDFVYQDGGQTSPTETIANATAMVAATWIKLGFFYNPLAPSTQKISMFINNQVQSTYITTTNIDASTFPENDAMTPVIGLKTGEATAVTLDCDWIAFSQVYDWVGTP